MRLETERGAISISPDVFTNITGAAAPTATASRVWLCAPPPTAWSISCAGNPWPRASKSASTTTPPSPSSSTFIVDNGVNLTAVSRSIMSEVRYIVERITGVKVKNVDVCVDSMVIG